MDKACAELDWAATEGGAVARGRSEVSLPRVRRTVAGSVSLHMSFSCLSYVLDLGALQTRAASTDRVDRGRIRRSLSGCLLCVFRLTRSELPHRSTSRPAGSAVTLTSLSGLDWLLRAFAAVALLRPCSNERTAAARCPRRRRSVGFAAVIKLCRGRRAWA